MIASPGSRTAATSPTVFSVISPDGTITQTARGAESIEASSCERAGSVGALAGEGRDGVGVDVVDDAAVAVSHQPPRHVRAHPTESDDPDLHVLNPMSLG